MPSVPEDKNRISGTRKFTTTSRNTWVEMGYISMDFVVGLPRTSFGYDAIWVVADRLTESTYFLLIRSTYTLDKLVEIYVKEIVCLHGMAFLVVSFHIENLGSPQDFENLCKKL